MGDQMRNKYGNLHEHRITTDNWNALQSVVSFMFISLFLKFASIAAPRLFSCSGNVVESMARKIGTPHLGYGSTTS